MVSHDDSRIQAHSARLIPAAFSIRHWVMPDSISAPVSCICNLQPAPITGLNHAGLGLFVSILLSDILPIFAMAIAGFLLARYAGIDVRCCRGQSFTLSAHFAFRLLVTRSADGVRVDRPLPEEIMRPVDILSDTALLVVILVNGYRCMPCTHSVQRR